MVGPGQHQRQRDEDEHGQADGQAHGDQADLPPWPRLLDVVGAVQRVDDRDQCRRTAPECPQHAKREQAAALGVSEALHLVLDEFQDLGRDHRPEDARQIVGQRLQREEAGQRQPEQDGREQREEEVVRQLRGHAEHVVVHDLVVRLDREVTPRQRRRQRKRHARCRCKLPSRILLICHLVRVRQPVGHACCRRDEGAMIHRHGPVLHAGDGAAVRRVRILRHSRRRHRDPASTSSS